MPRRALAGMLLVGLGLLLSPTSVPVYDGIGQPDEPYRFVATPSASPKTATATEAVSSTPVVGGRSSYGMNVQTAEQGPQLSLFLPPKAMAATAGPLEVRAVPQAPADQPAGLTIDGNVYLVTVTSPGGPVTLTPAAAIATVYLRATTSRQPGPVMQYRALPTDPWKALKTSRGGVDFYAAGYLGPGQYALAFAHASAKKGAGLPFAMLVLAGLVLLVVVVVVVRLRSAGR